MIIIRYRGGLGNQMFQYAFELAMKKFYLQVEVLADTSHYYMLNEHNGFELEKVFGISVSTPQRVQLKKISPYYVPSKVYAFLPEKVRRLIAHNLQYKYYDFGRKKKAGHYYKQEYHNTFEQTVFNLPSNQGWYLDGLWQDIRYFDACAQEVKDAFRFRNEDRYNEEDIKNLQLINQKNSVGIHVRRGDFINSKFDVCTMDYYREAIKIICENVVEAQFFLFTDDAEHVEKEFRWLEPKIIVNHSVENSIVDMELLSKCNHKIISNSTFAFWSAWLGKQCDSVIIAPKYSIIKPDKKFELNVPDGWIQI